MEEPTLIALKSFDEYSMKMEGDVHDASRMKRFIQSNVRPVVYPTRNPRVRASSVHHL